METDETNEVKEKDIKRLPIWASLLLFILGIFLFMQLYGIFAFAIAHFIFKQNFQLTGLTGNIVTESILFLSVLTSAILMLVIERRPFSDLGLSIKGHTRGILFGLLFAIFLYVIGFGLSLLLGEVEIVGLQVSVSSLLITFFFCLLVAFTEEIMMRGYILGHLLQTNMNKFLALFISAFLFSLLHLFNPNVAFLPMLNLVFAGMMLGASYLYTHNLCFPISLHLFWNWIQGPILGYQVSGNDLGASLLTLRLPEDNVINGGTFGFEGSLICTILMVLFTIAIIWWGEKRDAINLAVPRSC